MQKEMENYKEKGRRLSRRFSSRKKLGSLKTRFKKLLSDHQVMAGEAEDISSTTGSDSDTDGRKTSSPPPARSGEMKKSSSFGSSSDTDEESPPKLQTKKKSDFSSDSSEEKETGPSKSIKKKTQLHLQQEREELVRLPPLEETPTSPQSNPRFPTAAQSDYGRLLTNASEPNSPANLAHNLNISYRGGDSSPVALVHSLTVGERGKHTSQFSEISYASPASFSSLDLDVPGVKLEDSVASPSKTTPFLKPNGLPIVHHDEEQGVWRCGSCGWIYPNPNPSLRNRREHKQHCGEISNVQRWLGAQDIRDSPGEGSVKLEEDSEVWEASGLQDTLSTADEHPMGKFDGQDDNNGVSDRSADHHGSVDQGRLDDTESNGSPDHDAVGDEGNGGRSPSAAANPDEVEDQKLHRVLEWPPLDVGTIDHSNAEEMLSNGSTDPSASFKIPEVENEKEEAVEVEADEEVTQVVGSEVEAHERELNQKSQEVMENEGGDGQVQPVNGNGKRSFAMVHSNGHDVVHGDNIAGLKEDENANQDFKDNMNHPDDIGLTKVPEVHSEQSVATSDTGVGGQGIHVVRNKDDLDTQIPGDDEFSKEAVDVKATETTEPSGSTHKGWPIVLAEVVREPDVMEPTLARADLHSEETEIEEGDGKALKEVAREGINVDKVIPKLSEPSQNSSLETGKDTKTNGIVSDHSSEQEVSESDSMEGNSTPELPSQEYGIKTESGGRVGPPSPLEEAPKWMNSGVITSQDEGDAFTSVQKYWAGMTGSDYLLVEGKRSPSFGSCDIIGFPSFRNGEGRRSPSPFSLSKSGDGGVQSSPSAVSLDSRSTVEDKSEERAVPSSAVIHHYGSSSSNAHVDYDLEEVVREQNTHDLICPKCGADVTKRIILRKRKRSRVQEDHGREPKAITRQPGGRVEDQTPQVDESDDETWGCLACLSFFIRRGGGEVSQSSVPGAEPVETEQERVRCLPTLFGWHHETSKPELQVPLLGDTASEEVFGAVPERPPVNTGPDDERVSCFSYLQRSKRESPVEEATEESSKSNLQAGIEDEAANVAQQAEGVAEHGELPDGISEQRETVEQEKCECLPFFSFRSESSFAENIVTDTGRSPREMHPAEDPNKGGTSESLPASGVLSSHPEITSVIDRPEEALEDESEKRSCNCLSGLLPAFSWGPMPVYTDPPPDSDESGEMEQDQETTAISPIGSVSQEPRPLRVSEEKGTCSCLPVLPAFTWGSVPVYTHPPPETYEFSGEGQYEEASAGGLSGSEIQEPEAHEDSGEKRSCNCLPELLTFSWRSTPDNDTEIQSSPPATTRSIDEVPVDGDEDLQPSHLKAEAKESATCACLPFLLPALHWGFTRTTYKHGLQEPLLSQDPPAAGPVLLDETSSGPMQITEIPDPAIQGLEGMALVLARPVANVGGTTEITESEDFHIEGNVSVQKTTTKPSEDSVNIQQSNFHFTADIKDGHLSSTVEELKPELPLLNISNSDAVSSAPYYVSAGTSDEPERAPVESNTVDMSLSTSETHLELHRGRPSVDGTKERCNCLPSFPTFSLYDVFRDHHVPAGPRLPGTEGDDITAPLLGSAPHKPDTVVEIDHTETSIAVEGATSAEAAAEAIGIARDQNSSGGDVAPSEYLKSIVHGGLDVTLVSLGVVASGSGGDAKTITVVAIGLANLVFGLMRHVSTILSLYYNNRAQFQQEVGQGFIQGCLSVISFLFFGALSPITFGFSFRSAPSRNYKFAATCVVALVSIVLLGAASARVKSKSAVRVITTLIVTGFLAAIAGYETGNLVAELLEQWGFSSL